MRDTLEIESLLQAIETYGRYAREEEEARDAYGGPSWGYHGRRYVDQKEDAAEDVQNRLRSIINTAVSDALIAHGIVAKRSEMD